MSVCLLTYCSVVVGFSFAFVGLVVVVALCVEHLYVSLRVLLCVVFIVVVFSIVGGGVIVVVVVVGAVVTVVSYIVVVDVVVGAVGVCWCLCGC